TGSRRYPPLVPANRRAALLQDLLSGIAGLLHVAPDEPARRPGAFRQRALVIAEEAVRIEPAAPLLRQAAAELQRAAGAADDPAGPAPPPPSRLPRFGEDAPAASAIASSGVWAPRMKSFRRSLPIQPRRS